MPKPKSHYELLEEIRVLERQRAHQRSRDQDFIKGVNERLSSYANATPAPAPTPQHDFYPGTPSTPAKPHQASIVGDATQPRDKARISEPVGGSSGPDLGGQNYVKFALFGAAVGGLAGAAYAATFLQPLSWTHVAEIVAAFIAAAGAMFAVLCNPLVMASIAATAQYPKTMSVVWSGVLYGAFSLLKVVQ